MENLRKLMNKQDRRQAQLDTLLLRRLIVPLILHQQKGLCNICHKELKGVYQLYHIVYNPKVTIKELQLLCKTCHRAKTKKEIALYKTWS